MYLLTVNLHVWATCLKRWRAFDVRVRAKKYLLLLLLWFYMRWAGHVARIREKRMHIGYWWESQRERDH
jgi:hypothetical protein